MCRAVTGAGREKLKQDGVNIADWLTALALFTGHAAKVRLSLLRVCTLCDHVRGRWQGHQV
jgi:hypothetical protein